jgi:hypothetical protein
MEKYILVKNETELEGCDKCCLLPGSHICLDHECGPDHFEVNPDYVESNVFKFEQYAQEIHHNRDSYSRSKIIELLTIKAKELWKK